ncbi:MAG: hypothetical protein NVSMB27_43250 [Ktedonobacteraceae bacterium]
MPIGLNRVSLAILPEHWMVFFISKYNGAIRAEALTTEIQRLSWYERTSIQKSKSHLAIGNDGS